MRERERRERKEEKKRKEIKKNKRKIITGSDRSELKGDNSYI